MGTPPGPLPPLGGKATAEPPSPTPASQPTQTSVLVAGPLLFFLFLATLRHVDPGSGIRSEPKLQPTLTYTDIAGTPVP